MELDRCNKNTMWRDALARRCTMWALHLRSWRKDSRWLPAGWHKVTGHLVWDMKMDFMQKVRWVLAGHKTPKLIWSLLAGVVLRESVRITFIYTTLNGLDVCAANIHNAYLQAPYSEQDYIICSPEFGVQNVGRVALIQGALYGGKSASKDFRNHLRSCMHHLNFSLFPADPDVWMGKAQKVDGSPCYEYVLLYTDDALAVSEGAEAILRENIGHYFELKEESIDPLKIYLGRRVRKVKLDNGVKASSFSPSQYVPAAMKNVEEYSDRQDNKRWKLPANVNAPMQATYRPELDVTPELDGKYASYYQSLIGVLRWMEKLGRVDICLEVSILSSHLPCQERDTSSRCCKSSHILI